ncbi:hypothetical protein D3OALGA1CA_3927 [Olavius algarvensis associated proteobacterium Delta 3]|nr:hypothetical protein D3OALGB2SA_2125 [Olavius algarvensis associated proteobacterium Delta 3]CAB5142345.1 hypothetical protein D3OALGA1CA_3927 [Olavius algarvensis associated proteobacterium Delta 3]
MGGHLPPLLPIPAPFPIWRAPAQPFPILDKPCLGIIQFSDEQISCRAMHQEIMETSHFIDTTPLTTDATGGFDAAPLVG